jgi:hypothetical protein
MLHSAMADILEIIETNGEELNQNEELTIEYLSNDFLKVLGYNKLRDKGVKRVVGDVVDWAMYDPSGTLKLCVIARGLNTEWMDLKEEEIDRIKGSETLPEISETPILVTDFQRSLIYCLSIQDDYLISADIREESGLEPMIYISKEFYDKEKLIEEYGQKNENLPEDISELIADKDKKIAELQDTVRKLEKKLKTVEENAGTNNWSNSGQGDWDNKEKLYIERITLLTTQKEDAVANAVSLREDLNKLRALIDSQENSPEKIMTDILNDQNDSPEAPRKYIGVIGTRLRQRNSITKFIGDCLTELHEHVGLDLMPIIYDSDYFKYKATIVNPTDVDFRISGKPYEIDTMDLDEKELLDKLESVMSQFSGRVHFAYKLTGKAPPPVIKAVAVVRTESGDISEEEDNIGEVLVGIEEEENPELADVGEELAIGSGGGLEVEEAVIESEALSNNSEQEIESSLITGKIGIDKETDEPKEEELQSAGDGTARFRHPASPEYIGVALDNIMEVVGSEDVHLTDLQFVEAGGEVYEVNPENHGDINKIAVKCIDAMLAASSDISTAMDFIRNTNFSELSGFIQEITPENRRLPRISISNYVVDGVDTFKKLVPIVAGIGRHLKVKPKLYFKGEAEDKGYLRPYFTTSPLSGIVNQELLDSNWQVTYADRNEGLRGKIGIVTGLIALKNIPTKNNFIIQSQLIKSTEEIKFGSHRAGLKTPQDISAAIEEIFAMKPDIDVARAAESMGKVVNCSYPVLTTDIGLTGPMNTAVQIGGQEYYFTIEEPYQTMASIIKIFKVVHDNTGVAIKISMNQFVYDFYSSEFVTTNPTLRTTIRALLACIKTN